MNFSRFLRPDLINGNILSSLVSFTFPLLVSLVFQQLYNAVDAVIVGNFLKESSLAAIGSSAVLFELLVGFGNGFGNGLSIVAARAFGSGDDKKLKKVVASSLALTFFVTLFITVVSRFTLMKALTLLGTPEEIKDEAFSYINTVTLFVCVLFAFNFGTFEGNRKLLHAVGLSDCLFNHEHFPRPALHNENRHGHKRRGNRNRDSAGVLSPPLPSLHPQKSEDSASIKMPFHF